MDFLRVMIQATSPPQHRILLIRAFTVFINNSANISSKSCISSTSMNSDKRALIIGNFVKDLA
jgi:hypothetical protein